MGALYWIKLYHEILDDPKMGRLPDRTWRRAIEMFLLAGDQAQEGTLPPVADMAWRLRTTEDDLREHLQALDDVGILTETDGAWVVTHFAERQAQVPDAERSRRYRERKRKAIYYGDDSAPEREASPSREQHEPVTPPSRVVTQNQSRYRVEAEAEPPAPPPQAIPAVSLWCEMIGRPPTSRDRENLTDAINTYGEELLCFAITEAHDHGANTWAYVQAILENHKNDTGPPGSPQDRANELPGEFFNPLTGETIVRSDNGRQPGGAAAPAPAEHRGRGSPTRGHPY